MFIRIGYLPYDRRRNRGGDRNFCDQDHETALGLYPCSLTYAKYWVYCSDSVSECRDGIVYAQMAIAGSDRNSRFRPSVCLSKIRF